MNKTFRTAMAVAVALMMVVTVMPLSDLQSDAGSDKDPELKGPEMIDYGNKTYNFSFPLIDKTFGLDKRLPTFGDPTSGALDRRPLEMHMYDGSESKVSDHRFDVIEKLKTGYDMLTGIEFGARFSDNAAATGQDDLFVFGIDDEGNVKLSCNNAGEVVKSESGQRTYAGLLAERHTDLSAMQVANILCYAVGNFVDDDTEEVAVYMGDRIEIYDCVDGKISMVKEVTGIGSVDEFRPVSMSAGDTDLDGLDELAVAVGDSHTRSPATETDPGVRWTELFMLDPDGNKVLKTRLYCSGGEYATDCVATSVRLSDMDRDGAAELVLSGCLWDPEAITDGALMSGKNNIGSMFVSILEPGDLTAGEFTLEKPDYVTEWPVIRLSDLTDNAWGNCLLMNWSNWTIPMETCNLQGSMEYRDIYADFTVLSCTDMGMKQLGVLYPNEGTTEDNNYMCVSSGDCDVLDRKDAEYDPYSGSDEVYRFIASPKGGNIQWSMTTLYVGFGHEDIKTREFAKTPLVLMSDLRYGMPMACMLDWDPTDMFSVEYLGTIIGCTDPTVLAAISGVPYDRDLADILDKDANSIGRTDFTKSTGTGTSESSTYSVQFEVGGTIHTDFSTVSMHYGHLEGFADSQSQTVTISSTYSTSKDSMVLVVTPFESYNYKVGEYVDGKLSYSVQQAIRWEQPIEMVMEYDDYVKFVKLYNQNMKDYTSSIGREFVNMGVLNPFKHTEGDISTYREKPDSPLQEVNVSYTGKGSSGSITKCVDISKSTGSTESTENYMNLSESNGYMAYVDVDMKVGTTTTSCTTDIAGTGFSSTLTQGLVNEYMGSAKEAMDVLSGYGMTGSFWAENKTNGSDSYVYVGYTVNTFGSSPKLGWLSPDLYVPDGTDEDDPFNPTDDAVYILVKIPGDVRKDVLADRYCMQIEWQGSWYTISDAVKLKLKCERNVGENPEDMIFEEADTFDVIKKTDQEFWVRISGLSSIDSNSFDFRLMAEKGDAWNPSMAETAYLDIRKAGSLSMQPVTGDLGKTDHAILRNNDLILAEDSVLVPNSVIFVNTDLEPGTNIDIYSRNNGDITLLEENFDVGVDGHVVLVFSEEDEPAPSDDRSVPLPIAAIVFVGILAMLAVGAYILRR